MPASRIRNLATKWSAKRPELAARIERAIALTGGVKSQGEGVYVVEGVGGDYIVTKGRNSMCTCPDSQRGNRCKHQLAVALVCIVEREATVLEG
jgi:predicted nucleic acid-binding Zn finger protein